MTEKTWTMTQVIGHNVKTRRETQQMTAKNLGATAGGRSARRGLRLPT